MPFSSRSAARRSKVHRGREIEVHLSSTSATSEPFAGVDWRVARRVDWRDARRWFAALILGLGLTACATFGGSGGPGFHHGRRDTIARVAQDYVRLTLEIGAREPGYVDAYYGPPEWKREAEASPRPVADLAAAAASLQERLRALPPPPRDLDMVMQLRRRDFLDAQLTAARTRLRMLGGERLTFQEEASGLFGVEVRLRPLSSYDPIIERIERLVPGRGPLADRIEAFQSDYVIPNDRLDAVMRAAIAECRRRTLENIRLPRGEAFTLELVRDRSWSGYNFYQGRFHSLIQVNTDLPTRLPRAIGLGCHEGYPGHHAYNALLEQHLARRRGWVEYMVYPLYSPQSLIAEGSADYGAELAFPGVERTNFETQVLYPLAGLSPDSAERFGELQEALGSLSSARFTIARDYLEGRLTRPEALLALQRYQLVGPARAQQSLAFIDQYRSYVINYGLGRELVRRYIERTNNRAERWERMRRILTEPTLPGDLVEPDQPAAAAGR